MRPSVGRPVEIRGVLDLPLTIGTGVVPAGTLTSGFVAGAVELPGRNAVRFPAG
jgi:hypothetical protein